MKTLFLVRHGKSSWVDPLLTDFERPLNDRGRANSRTLAQYLAENKIIPELILSSPANRAITTARVISTELKYPLTNIAIKEEIYEATPERLLKLIQEQNDAFGSMMLFGHNPGFIMLAQELLTMEIEFFPTCAICGITFSINSWKDLGTGKGNCIIFKSPKKDFLLK